MNTDHYNRARDRQAGSSKSLHKAASRLEDEFGFEASGSTPSERFNNAVTIAVRRYRNVLIELHRLRRETKGEKAD